MGELPLKDVPIRSIISGQSVELTLLRVPEEHARWIKKVVDIGPGQLANAPKEVTSDRATIWVTTLYDVRAVKHASVETLLGDECFAATLLQQNAEVPRHVPAEVATNEKFLLTCA